LKKGQKSQTGNIGAKV